LDSLNNDETLFSRGIMTLFLDSANVSDARQAAELGFVAGLTTNPTLIAKVLNSDGPTPSGVRPKNRHELVAAICDAFPGIVMVQLTASTAKEREAEGRQLLNIRRGQVGLKIPSVMENFALARHFAAEGHTVGMTTIFSAGQVYLACEAGARFVFPYVNRSTRLLGDGLALVRQMRAVIQALQSPVQILAASIKTPTEGVDTLLAGANGLTVPLELLLALGNHPFSDQAIAEFSKV
jgi:transaldolase